MRITVQFFFAWFDFWIGFYYDRKKRVLYINPLPCCAFAFRIRVQGPAPGMCKCGHHRDIHDYPGCLAPNDTLSWNIYCPCYVPKSLIEPDPAAPLARTTKENQSWSC